MIQDKSQSLWHHQMTKQEFKNTLPDSSEGKKVWYWNLVKWSRGIIEKETFLLKDYDKQKGPETS